MGRHFPRSPADRNTLLIMFFSCLAQSLAALRAAVAESDFHQIEYLAHRTRGSAGYIGAVRIAKVFQEMEEQAPLGAATTIEGLLRDAMENHANLRAYCRLHWHEEWAAGLE